MLGNWQTISTRVSFQVLWQPHVFANATDDYIPHNRIIVLNDVINNTILLTEKRKLYYKFGEPQTRRGFSVSTDWDRKCHQLGTTEWTAVMTRWPFQHAFCRLAPPTSLLFNVQCGSTGHVFSTSSDLCHKHTQ